MSGAVIFWKAAPYGIIQCNRLLENLLLHVMIVPVQIGKIGVPIDDLDVGMNGGITEVLYRKLIAVDVHNFVVGQIDNVLCSTGKCTYVTGQE